LTSRERRAIKPLLCRKGYTTDLSGTSPRPPPGCASEKGPHPPILPSRPHLGHFIQEEPASTVMTAPQEGQATFTASFEPLGDAEVCGAGEVTVGEGAPAVPAGGGTVASEPSPGIALATTGEGAVVRVLLHPRMTTPPRARSPAEFTHQRRSLLEMSVRRRRTAPRRTIMSPSERIILPPIKTLLPLGGIRKAEAKPRRAPTRKSTSLKPTVERSMVTLMRQSAIKLTAFLPGYCPSTPEESSGPPPVSTLPSLLILSFLIRYSLMASLFPLSIPK